MFSRDLFCLNKQTSFKLGLYTVHSLQISVLLFWCKKEKTLHHFLVLLYEVFNEGN